MSPLHDGAGGVLDRDRRSFLKLGLAGSLVLGTVGVTAGVAGCHRREEAAAQGYRFLRDGDVTLFRALIPVVLAGLLPAEAGAHERQVADVLQRIDGGCLRLGAPARKEVLKLLDLLNLGITRRLAAGVATTWDRASEADIAAFLDRWRNSAIGLFNAGYRVLAKLVTVSHYGTPASWPAAGYPGPLAWMFDAINH